MSRPSKKKVSWLSRNWWIFLALGLCLLTHLPRFFQPLTQADSIQIMAVASKPFDLYHYQPQQLNYDPPAIYYLLKTGAKLAQTDQILDTPTIAISPSQIIAYHSLTTVLPNLLSLFGFYLLATKFLKRKNATLVAFLIALLPLIYLPTLNLQPLAWTLTALIWSWLFLLEMLGVGRNIISARRDSALGRFLRLIPFGYNYLFFFAFTILGIYTSYYYFLFLLIQLITMGFFGRWKRLLLTLLLVIIAYIPWFPFIHRQLQIIPAYQQILEKINL